MMYLSVMKIIFSILGLKLYFMYLHYSVMVLYRKKINTEGYRIETKVNEMMTEKRF